MVEGMQFGADGPVMKGTWFNPTTKHKFTVRDSFFQDGQFVVQTTDGQILDYNMIQSYVQLTDEQGVPQEPDTVMSKMPNQAEALPPEVADLLIPEDEDISKGLGNLNNRNFTPSLSREDVVVEARPEHTFTVGSAEQDQDMAMVERVLRKHPIPDFEAQLVWQCPTKQIETLIDVLGIDPETIASYYVNKLDAASIFEGIKIQLTNYIQSQWGVVPQEVHTQPVEAPKKAKPTKKGTKKPTKNKPHHE